MTGDSSRRGRAFARARLGQDSVQESDARMPPARPGLGRIPPGSGGLATSAHDDANPGLDWPGSKSVLLIAKCLLTPLLNSNEQIRSPLAYTATRYPSWGWMAQGNSGRRRLRERDSRSITRCPQNTKVAVGTGNSPDFFGRSGAVTELRRSTV